MVVLVTGRTSLLPSSSPGGWRPQDDQLSTGLRPTSLWRRRKTKGLGAAELPHVATGRTSLNPADVLCRSQGVGEVGLHGVDYSVMILTFCGFVFGSQEERGVLQIPVFLEREPAAV